MLTFEIPAIKCLHGVEVNWSRYLDTGVNDPALVRSPERYILVSPCIDGRILNRLFN